MSTSSEFNDNGNYYDPNHIFVNAPMYPVTTQPNVYYVQAPNSVEYRSKCPAPQKKSRNFFVKAFHWYTQDLGPKVDNSKCLCPGVNGFAKWLDSKYNEYRRDNIMNNNYGPLRAKRTSTVIINKKLSGNLSCACSSSKQRSKRRSPWRKRKRAANIDTKQLCEPCKQSCEFIMKPKDLSCHASECGYSDKPCSRIGSEKSIIAVVIKKAIIKSQTTLSQGDNNEITRGTLDKKFNKNTSESKEKIDKPYTDMSIQCSHEKGTKKDASTLYEDHERSAKEKPQVSLQTSLIAAAIISSSRPCVKSEEVIKRPCTVCQCSAKNIETADVACQYDPSDLCEVLKHELLQQNVIATSTLISTSSISKHIQQVSEEKQNEVCFVNDAMQTSDHSIRLDYDYPLFMKIICADKL